MNELKTALLREIAAQEGEATQADLRHISGDQTRTLMTQLRDAGLIQSDYVSGQLRTYTVTDAGRKALHTAAKPMGQFPAARTSPSPDKYQPTPFLYREGAPNPADFTSDGKPYKRPIIMSSGVPGAPLGR